MDELARMKLQFVLDGVLKEKVSVDSIDLGGVVTVLAGVFDFVLKGVKDQHNEMLKVQRQNDQRIFTHD